VQFAAGRSRGSEVGKYGGVSDATDTLNWTTDPVDLPGVDPADPPTELVAGKLWHGGCPVDFEWVHESGIDVVLDLADADAYPPADLIEGLIYLKCPLVDQEDLPEPGLTLRLAALVAGLVRDGHQALVHCTFGRNRSGLVATLVVRELLGLSGSDALEYIQARRDRVANNDTFAEWLATLPAPGPSRD
jgi:hypothetical protein